MTYDYSGHAAIPATNKLAELADLATQLTSAELRVVQLSNDLADAKNELSSLANEKIPQLMEELGIEEFKLASGRKVKLGRMVFASIPKTSSRDAFEWLIEHGHGGMIKSSVVVPFSQQQVDSADKLAKVLKERFPYVTQNRKIEPMTLKAWARRRLEEGEAIPESISVHVKKTAEIG